MKKFALMLASAMLVMSAAGAMAAVPSKTTTDVTQVKAVEVVKEDGTVEEAAWDMAVTEDAAPVTEEIAKIYETVAAKGENMLDMVLLQCLADLEKLFLAAAHTGDMRHGINAEGVLDVGGNLYGFPGTAAACAVGNTDKIGL